jgi:hypothetical protein
MSAGGRLVCAHRHAFPALRATFLMSGPPACQTRSIGPRMDPRLMFEAFLPDVGLPVFAHEDTAAGRDPAMRVLNEGKQASALP